MSLHGSYRPQDVEFLLKPITMAMIDDVADKERLIQSGARHYSEMLSPERLPSTRYLELFRAAHAMNREQMARDCLLLARAIVEQVGTAPTIVSLARAGTPIGVILGHTLQHLTGRAVPHYSISIIRDRGIDTNALDAILDRGADPASIVFVDGWTGKGVITEELHKAVTAYNHARGTAIAQHLYVLSDLAGCAHCAASTEDYLIPSSILNATISGLVSRSVLNDAIGPQDFHGCVVYEEFAPHDLSVWFVEDILRCIDTLRAEGNVPALPPRYDRNAIARATMGFLAIEMARYGILDRNLIKPGIGEVTRVLLRRLPQRMIVRDRNAACVQHLLVLAEEKNVPVDERPSLPFHALAIIRSALDV
ncbi:cysteine protease StiP family protein [Candidatus Symbiobacter mobilis]|uniref:Uncharacterized protein n=1 Tax=Candidatus Symbiobacter mobilis CR TaxID=946483 RepID=U5NAN4_9BURK|nr:cysteine protease StiP family protein [Candidatus Symbiobacter mobilis]AGX87259.1 hypothetical protein Cenrod_1166 [Candidatus Symbiobacter mobilis CR]